MEGGYHIRSSPNSGALGAKIQHKTNSFLNLKPGRLCLFLDEIGANNLLPSLLVCSSPGLKSTGFLLIHVSYAFETLLDSAEEVVHVFSQCGLKHAFRLILKRVALERGEAVEVVVKLRL